MQQDIKLRRNQGNLPGVSSLLPFHRQEEGVIDQQNGMWLSAEAMAASDQPPDPTTNTTHLLCASQFDADNDTNTTHLFALRAL